MCRTREIQQLSVLIELSVTAADGSNFALNFCWKKTIQMEFTPMRASALADQQWKGWFLKDEDSFHFVSKMISHNCLKAVRQITKNRVRVNELLFIRWTI